MIDLTKLKLTEKEPRKTIFIYTNAHKYSIVIYDEKLVKLTKNSIVFYNPESISLYNYQTEQWVDINVNNSKASSIEVMFSIISSFIII